MHAYEKGGHRAGGEPHGTRAHHVATEARANARAKSPCKHVSETQNLRDRPLHRLMHCSYRRGAESASPISPGLHTGTHAEQSGLRESRSCHDSAGYDTQARKQAVIQTAVWAAAAAAAAVFQQLRCCSCDRLACCCGCSDCVRSVHNGRPRPLRVAATFVRLLRLPLRR